MKGGGSGAEALAPTKPTFTLFALAEVRGQIGPCGCTSDPLGDIARTAQLVADARAAGPVMVVDAGSLLYSQNPVPPHLDAQETLKAQLIQKIYWTDLNVAGVGLGPMDLAKGQKGSLFGRQAANLLDESFVTAPPTVVDVGTAKVGLFGVIAKDAIPGLQIEDPVVAGKRSIKSLHDGGAQVIVALVQAASKRDAVKLVRDIGGIDFTIAGLGINAPEPEAVVAEAEKIDSGWLVVPANRGQVLSRIDVTLRGGAPFADAIGPAGAAARRAQIDKQLAALDADLAKFAADPTADPKFVAAKQQERTQLAADRAKLEAHPVVAPAHGSFFTLDQIRINKTLACSVPVQDAVKSFDLGAGEANVKANEATPVPAPAKGQASYVGGDTCSDCHSEQAEFWKKTVHAQAWQTLVDRSQQFDYECIGCHVTGWEKPGGANLAHNEKLRDVQCEVCHGPSSIHVAKGGNEKPAALILKPAADLCATQCHTHEHSDTFQREAYLRDILGPGHGAEARKKLGDGPTGHDLRKAALDKAGHTLGAGCTR